MAPEPIKAFDFEPGEIVAKKYEVVRRLGAGYEGETYLLRERSTRIDRAGKFFFPQRNRRDLAARRSARKLHKLAGCSSVVGYHGREELVFAGQTATFLVSEYVRGESLTELVERQPGKRLHPYQGLHVLRALADGVACVHGHGEYHGDLHSDNVIVERFGLSCELKILDFYDYGPSRRSQRQADLLELVRLFYDVLGGKKHYARQPQWVKEICRGLRRTLILDRYPTVRRLVAHLERIRL